MIDTFCKKWFKPVRAHLTSRFVLSSAADNAMRVRLVCQDVDMGNPHEMNRRVSSFNNTLLDRALALPTNARAMYRTARRGQGRR